MSLLLPIPLLALLLAFLLYQKKGQLSAAQARQYWLAGARLIDVRTRGEFNAGHLARAQNIPLDEIDSSVPKLLDNKQEVLLFHCQSGVRSGMAQRKLRALGYGQVFNLGSYARARGIVDG